MSPKILDAVQLEAPLSYSGQLLGGGFEPSGPWINAQYSDVFVYEGTQSLHVTGAVASLDLRSAPRGYAFDQMTIWLYWELLGGGNDPDLLFKFYSEQDWSKRSGLVVPQDPVQPYGTWTQYTFDLSALSAETGGGANMQQVTRLDVQHSVILPLNSRLYADDWRGSLSRAGSLVEVSGRP